MGTSAKLLKNRIKSVESTMHITKAMELVASSKLRKATERCLRSRAYFVSAKEAFSELAATNREAASAFLTRRAELKKVCYVVIGGDRGLAGGYNNNLFKEFTAAVEVSGTGHIVLPIGKKTVDYVKKKGYEVLTENYRVVEALSLGDCAEIGRLLCREYSEGGFDELRLVYTHFRSMLSQSPDSIPLLPIAVSEEEAANVPKRVVLYEPSAEAVLSAVVPEYVGGMIYSAICDSFASELAARRNAMDNASKNAGDMIEQLSLQYNHARQGAITQEITEIISGAEAGA